MITAALDAVDAFRVLLGVRPLLLTALVYLALLALDQRLFAPTPTATQTPSGRALAIVSIVGVVGLVAYPAISLWYAFDPHFFDNAEPTIPSIAWMFHLGHPLYPDVAAAERYAHIYGPMTFIVQGAALGWFGPSILVSKLVGALAGLVSVAGVFAVARCYVSLTRAAVMSGVCAVMLLMFRHASFWDRPDALQVAAVSAALCFAARPWPWGAVIVGLASGALWNLKFTGPLYSLPVFAILYCRQGLRPVAVAAGIGVTTAALPLMVFLNISLTNYLAWVRLSGETGLLLSTLRQNIEWAAFLGMPLLLVHATQPQGRDDHRRLRWLPEVALLAGMCAVALAAAKPGAGPYHLMPFVPTVMCLVARQLGDHPWRIAEPSAARFFLSLVITLVIAASVQQAQLIRTMVGRHAVSDVDDVRRFLGSHQGSVAMAYGRTESLSHAQPLLTFRSNDYLIDQPAVREHQLQGVSVPQATIDAVARCRIAYWLVPKGEPPFGGVNGYAAVFQEPLYPDALRRAFAAAHVIRGSTAYYDVWQCRGAPSR